jgi:hypothetical protein
VTCPEAIALAAKESYDELLDYWYADAPCDCAECIAVHKARSEETT